MTMSRSNVQASGGGASLREGLPRGPLSPQQQMEALRLVQARAEQRVKLGMKLLEAAQARLTNQQDLLDQAKREQRALLEQMQQEIAQDLQSRDERIQAVDDRLTQAIESLEQKLQRLQKEWSGSLAQMEAMVQRSESLLDQTRYLLAEAERRFGIGPAPASNLQLKPAQEPASPPTASPSSAGNNNPPSPERLYREFLEYLRRQPPAA